MNGNPLVGYLGPPLLFRRAMCVNSPNPNAT